MDYRTLFLTYLASITVYTVFALLLAQRNRKVRGLCWIAAGLLICFIKVVLQGFDGRISSLFTSLVANELYLASFIMQWMGLRWFVDRTPLRHIWPLVVTAISAGLYAVLYLFHIRYIGNLINVPMAIVIGYTAWTLVRRGTGLFYLISRWTAVFLTLQTLVSIYRAVLTNIHYAKPWKLTGARLDPQWNYSLMAMMFVTTCVTMCCFWFFVVELQSELVLQSRTDALTGALNRRALYVEADREIARALRNSQPLCVLILDIDDFKHMNDTYGHAAGDLALQELVQRIKAALRTNDVLARTGGEEFTILLPNTTAENAESVAERVRIAVAALDLRVDQLHLHISVSIGVAELSPSCAFEKVLMHADEAMYIAKRNGKNRTIVFQPSSA